MQYGRKRNFEIREATTVYKIYELRVQSLTFTRLKQLQKWEWKKYFSAHKTPDATDEKDVNVRLDIDTLQQQKKRRLETLSL